MVVLCIIMAVLAEHSVSRLYPIPMIHERI